MTHLFRCCSLIVLLTTLTMTLPVSIAQEKAEPTVEGEAKAKGRLPAYYKDVVDESQRDAIYKIQADYSEKILTIQEQVKKLIAERDAAIEKTLSAEQLAKLKKIQEEAAAKRKAAGLGPAAKAKTAEKAPAAKEKE